MSSPAPVPCAHCGYHYMRHNLDPNIPRLCNSCLIREQKRTGEKIMSNTKFIIECDEEDQISVEEICLTEGLTFSKYFIGLHRANLMLKSIEENRKDTSTFTETSPASDEYFKEEKKELDSNILKKAKGAKK